MDKPKQYQYDIFEPGSLTKTFLHLHEVKPLLDFQVGDIIHGEFLHGNSIQKNAPALRIIARKHVLWNSEEGETIHQILIYTKSEGISELPF